MLVPDYRCAVLEMEPGTAPGLCPVFYGIPMFWEQKQIYIASVADPELGQD